MLGALVIPPIAIPAVVHWTNAGAGSFPRALGASLIGGVAGFALGAANHSLTGVLLGPPMGELLGSLWAETR